MSAKANNTDGAGKEGKVSDDKASTDSTPTKAIPGSGAKVDVLTKRAAAGLPLWNPEDSKFVDSEESLADPDLNKVRKQVVRKQSATGLSKKRKKRNQKYKKGM